MTQFKPPYRRRYQLGVSLIVTMLMIVIVASLAAASAKFALSGERSAGGDRDRELAFQSAQKALDDGERDVRGGVGTLRSSDFCPSLGIVGKPASGCASDPTNLGKCATSNAGSPPSWLTVDWSSGAVPVGTFTGGAVYPTQKGIRSWIPSTSPRYVIEQVSDRQQDALGGFTDQGLNAAFLFQVTAIGYGTRPETKVLLQSTIRKTQCPAS